MFEQSLDLSLLHLYIVSFVIELHFSVSYTKKVSDLHTFVCHENYTVEDLLGHMSKQNCCEDVLNIDPFRELVQVKH